MNKNEQYMCIPSFSPELLRLKLGNDSEARSYGEARQTHERSDWTIDLKYLNLRWNLHYINSIYDLEFPAIHSSYIIYSNFVRTTYQKLPNVYLFNGDLTPPSENT